MSSKKLYTRFKIRVICSKNVLVNGEMISFGLLLCRHNFESQLNLIKKIEIKILLICNAYLMNIYWFRLIAIFQINICVITFSFKCLNPFRVDARVRSAITKGTLFYASYRDRQTDSSIKKTIPKQKHSQRIMSDIKFRSVTTREDRHVRFECTTKMKPRNDPKVTLLCVLCARIVIAL